jgi:hypothetical protein
LLRSIKLTAKPALEETKLRWDLKGRVTAGPFRRSVPKSGERVGCIVDGRRLVWIDPRAKAILWEYSTGGATIVGEPQMVNGKLVVADQGGAIVALDPATGKPQSKGYVLPGSAAPAAPPVAFDGQTLFTPLTDGTVILLPLRLFQ